MSRTPAALVLVLSAAASAGGTGDLHVEGYVETRRDGTYVDWLDGFVGVTGQTPVLRPLSNPIFYGMTKRRAETEGRDRILDALRDLRVEGELRLGQERGVMERLEERSRGLEAEEIRSDRRPMFRVVLKLPLRGEGSAMELLVAARRPQAPREGAGSVAAASWSEGEPEEPTTGLVVDARNLHGETRPAPALLPRIVDPEGRVVYDLAAAHPDVAVHRGLAGYANAFTSTAGVPLRERPREGEAPLTVAAIGVAGEGTDLVIAAQDADRILAAASRSAFLEECRVLVLLPPPPPPVQVLPPRRPETGGQRAEDANLPQP